MTQNIEPTPSDADVAVEVPRPTGYTAPAIVPLGNVSAVTLQTGL